jgi:hypothetical protein
MRGARSRRYTARRTDSFTYYRVRSLESAIQRNEPEFRYETIRQRNSNYDSRDIRYLERYLRSSQRRAYEEACRVRRQAVKQAWRMERELVKRTGRGTRDWTPEEIGELKETGRVTGYHGHHINSLTSRPEFASEPYNIIFLTPKEHLHHGHGGNWRNPSSGNFIYR